MTSFLNGCNSRNVVPTVAGSICGKCQSPSVISVLSILLVALTAAVDLRAATIQADDVTSKLGPTFFVDDVTLGGGDLDFGHNSTASFIRLFNGLLTLNQGPTRVVLTGLGFFAHPDIPSNDATTISVTFTYLGADQAVGGGDDVAIGTATGSYDFSGGGEYVFAFDSPLSANLTITGTKFLIQIAPTNANHAGFPDTVLKIKTGPLAYETTAGPKLSVAGIAAPLLNPQRVNLAKFQPVTTGSVNGQRLASYVTDGVTGNDNRWDGQNWAYNYARVDFPFPVEVGSAQVFMGVDDDSPVTNFSIQYLDGTTWTTLPGGSVSGNTNVERNIVFTAPTTASNFRFISENINLRIRELALYPPLNGIPTAYPLGTDLTVNLAYQRPADASSNVAGNFALNAVDGRANGPIWQTSTPGTNTLDIDLRVSTKIGSAHLYSGSTGVSPLANFTLKYWNGTTWQNITGGGVTGNSTADLVLSFTPVITTMVRLEFTNPGTTSVRELCIFPANTGNTGYPIGTNITASGAVADYETYNDAFWKITNPTSNRFITVAGSQPALDQAGLTTAQGQYQVLLNLSTGTYRLRNRDTGNCLSGSQLSKTPGLALTDAPYTALPDQDWILDPLGGGVFRIINQWSGLAIDTQGAATAAGTPLVQNTASSSSPTQRWRFSYSDNYPKKGIGGTSFALATDPDWAYNWGRTYSNPIPETTSYFPMQWGNFNWDIGSDGGPIAQEYPGWRKRADSIHLLGFNEPDARSQSGGSLDPLDTSEANFSITRSANEAVRLWPRVQSMDLPLVSPSPANTTNPWFSTFFTQVDTLGYRVDYTAVHTYPSPNGGSSDELVDFVQAAYNNWDRPVWLTEFSFVNWDGNGNWTEEDNYNCLAEFLWRAENLSALRKYALFVFTEVGEWPAPANPWSTVGPRSNSYNISGNLTAFGELYSAWDNDPTIRANKTYHIHHKLTRKRIANFSGALEGRTIRVDGPLVNWTLANTGTAGKYYVVSSGDGRRLSSVAGAAPTLAAAGTTGANVEWSLTPTQYGWHYLVHAASTRRLQMAFNNGSNAATYTMALNTTTGEGVEWRFIVPLPDNAAPVLATIPAQVVNELTSVNFTASATDTSLPAGPITYSLVNPPFNSSINSSTGVFSWTPTETQGNGTNYAITVRASDGQLATNRTVSITVNEVNSSPVLATIPAQTVNEGTLLTFTASATDADIPANTLTYSLVNAPGGAAINGSTGEFTWTPSEIQGPGVFNFTVRAGDGNLTHDRSVSVTVNEVSTAPVLAAITAKTVSEGSLLTFTASATDVDVPANTLTYSLIGAPGGAVINSGTGVFTWTPTEAQGPGSFNFTVRASDGVLTHTQAVSVTVNEASSTPLLASIPSKTVAEASLLTFTASATDADIPANTLTYSLIGAPSGAAIVGSTGVFTWTPGEVQGPGIFNFSVRVSDGNLTHDQAVSVTVSEVNVAPILAVIPPQTVTEGTLLTFTASATDADLPFNTLTYSLLGEPLGAAIDTNTGIFTWTPTEAQGPADFSFTVRASDGFLTHDQAVTVAVGAGLPSANIDSDGDGLSDLLELAFVTDPAIPNGNPFRVISATTGTVTLEFPWNWQATGLNWQVRHGHDLTTISTWPVVSPGTTTITREGNVDRITITPVMAHPGRGFYILEVSGN